LKRSLMITFIFFTRINIIKVKYSVESNGEKERKYLYFLYSC